MKGGSSAASDFGLPRHPSPGCSRPVIPLRILHVLTPDPARRVEAGELALLRWQLATGHGVAVVLAGPAPWMPPPAGATMLGVRRGTWDWWRRTRATVAASAAAWVADVVHIHQAGALVTGLDLAQRLGLPCVASIDQFEGSIDRFLLHLRRPAWVLVPSEHDRAELVARHRLPRDGVAVLPPGLDAAHLAPPPPPRDGPLVVGALADLADRSLRALAAATAARRAVGQDLRLLVAGPGAERAVRGLDGVQADETMGASDLVARCGIYAALGPARAAFPALVEALARGRPVLADAGRAVAEYADGGQAALLTDPRNPAALAAALATLGTHSATAELGQAARTVATARFPISAVGEAAIELYRTALGGGTARVDGTTAYRRLTGQAAGRDTASGLRAVRPPPVDSAGGSGSIPVGPR